MLKKYIVTILLLLPLLLAGQQDHHYTQFMYNKLLYNPAYAGARGVPTATALYRNQWVQLDGAPSSALVSLHAPVFSDRVGVGGLVSLNEIGLHRDYNLGLSYSFALVMKQDFTLSLGLSGNLRMINMELDKAKPLFAFDPSLDGQRINDTYANFGAGVYATFQERLFFGVSVPRIMKNNIGINETPGIVTARETPHFYGTTGGIIPLGKDLNLLPAVLVKYVAYAPLSVDLNVNLEIMQKFTAGLSYRIGGDGSGESIDVLAYWRVNQLIGFGASYDITMSKLRDYSGGSFEFMLLADLKKRKKGMSNPRFFM